MQRSGRKRSTEIRRWIQAEEPGQPIVVGPSPEAMAVTPDGRTVLVLTSAGVTGVTPVDAVTNRAGKPVAIQGAYALAVAPGGGTAYVLAMPDSDSRQGFVVPVHIRAGTAGTPIKVGLNPVQIAFTPDGKMAYVANYASRSVTPIRLADGRAGPAIATGKIPTRLAVSPDSTTVYVLDSNIYGEMGPEMPFGAQVRMLSRILFSASVKKPPSWRGQVIPIRVAANSAGKPIKVGGFWWPLRSSPEPSTRTARACLISSWPRTAPSSQPPCARAHPTVPLLALCRVR